MASCDTGYEDERFQHPVGQSFHCGICYNVVKDPTMCRHNEHLFCRACITRSLVNSQTCPSCVEPLTVETLTQPSRTVMNLLSELKIRCQFFNRGCEKFIELGNLERHIADCGFAPAVCSNEGCRIEVNKQDLLHHEMAVCELWRVQCHSCNEIRQEMDIVKVNLAAMNAKLLEVGEKMDRNEKKLDENHENVKGVVANVQEQLNKQEESNRQLKADNLETKKCLSKITQQLEGVTQQASHVVPAAQQHGKKRIAEAGGMDREPKIVVVGGWNRHSLNSVEVFSFSNATWQPLQRMKVARSFPSSFINKNQIFVTGGHSKGRGFKSMEKISMKAVDADESFNAWEIFLAELPAPLWGHCSVVYNGRLIVIGGRCGSELSNRITDISLGPPYTGKLLATMPVSRQLHCALLFGGKIVILGGKNGVKCSTALKTVLMYDIVRNEYEELAPLPYPVAKMAAVKWGDDNVIIMGGADIYEKPLNKVLIYNIKTQKSHMLPDMKSTRMGCVAAVVRDTVIVIGGEDEQGNTLKSVESFKFDRFTWEEFPEMLEAKSAATAVIC